MYWVMTGGVGITAEEEFILKTNISTGNYGPRRATLETTFQAKKDSTIRIAIGHVIQVRSQDGLVEVLGTVGTHFDAYSPAGRKPLLRYVMTPL
jgi:hypothetical protein